MIVYISTNKYKNVPIKINYILIPRNQIETNKNIFDEMCNKGCKNYNTKYSCPPRSPKFETIKLHLKYIFVFSLRVKTNNFGNDREYFKLTRANVVLEGRATNLIRLLEEKILNSYALINGSCRICKRCGLKDNKKCNFPDKLRFSMESTGIDCNKLAEKYLNFNLLWYKNNTAPKYVTMMCALLTNINPEKEFLELIKEIK